MFKLVKIVLVILAGITLVEVKANQIVSGSGTVSTTYKYEVFMLEAVCAVNEGTSSIFLSPKSFSYVSQLEKNGFSDLRLLNGESCKYRKETLPFLNVGVNEKSESIHDRVVKGQGYKQVKAIMVGYPNFQKTLWSEIGNKLEESGNSLN